MALRPGEALPSRQSLRQFNLGLGEIKMKIIKTAPAVGTIALAMPTAAPAFGQEFPLEAGEWKNSSEYTTR